MNRICDGKCSTDLPFWSSLKIMRNYGDGKDALHFILFSDKCYCMPPLSLPFSQKPIRINIEERMLRTSRRILETKLCLYRRGLIAQRCSLIYCQINLANDFLLSSSSHCRCCAIVCTVVICMKQNSHIVPNHLHKSWRSRTYGVVCVGHLCVNDTCAILWARGVTGEVCATCVWQFKCYLKIDNDAVEEDECRLPFTQCGNYLSLHCQSYKWYSTLDASEMMGDTGAHYAIAGRSNVTHTNTNIEINPITGLGHMCARLCVNWLPNSRMVANWPRLFSISSAICRRRQKPINKN